MSLFMARRICLFCQRSGHAKITKEHVWPKWVSALMPGADKHVPSSLRSTELKEIVKWTGDGIQVNDVCRNCNSGWMSQMEGEVKAVLGTLIVGSIETRPITLADPAVIGKWALKLSMMADATTPLKKRFFTAKERSSLKAGDMAPRGLYYTMFMGRLEGQEMGLEAFFYTYPLPMSLIVNAALMTIGVRAVFTA